MGRVGRAQRLAGRLRSRTRMRTTTTISVVLALPLPDRDRPRFESPVAGTGDRFISVGEEARTFNRALLRRQGASCRTIAVARSSRSHGASLHSSPSFSSSRYIASVSVVSVSPPLPRNGHFRRGGHRRRHPPVARHPAARAKRASSGANPARDSRIGLAMMSRRPFELVGGEDDP